MAEATFVRKPDVAQVLADATIDAGQLVYLPSGEVGFLDATAPVSSGEYTDDMRSGAKVTLEKTTSVVMLAGQDAYWDASANKYTYKPVSDRDVRVGVNVDDVTSAAITGVVDLNKPSTACRNLLKDAAISVYVGTPAAGGFGYPVRMGGSATLALTSTSEAQKIDILGVDGFDVTGGWILDIWWRVESVGSATAPDLSLGIASGTNATDADAIATSAFFHMNGNDLSIFVETDDATTDSGSIDTTINATAGTAQTVRVHGTIDGRDLTSVKFYIDGARVNSGTTFNMALASGTVYLLAHLEKTASADTFIVHLDKAELRLAD